MDPRPGKVLLPQLGGALSERSRTQPETRLACLRPVSERTTISERAGSAGSPCPSVAPPGFAGGHRCSCDFTGTLTHE